MFRREGEGLNENLDGRIRYGDFKMKIFCPVNNVESRNFVKVPCIVSDYRVTQCQRGCANNQIKIIDGRTGAPEFALSAAQTSPSQPE